MRIYLYLFLEYSFIKLLQTWILSFSAYAHFGSKRIVERGISDVFVWMSMLYICQVVVYRMSDQGFVLEEGGDSWLDLFEYRSSSEVVRKDTMDWRSASSIQTGSSTTLRGGGGYSRRKSEGAIGSEETRREVRGLSRLGRRGRRAYWK